MICIKDKLVLFFSQKAAATEFPTSKIWVKLDEIGMCTKKLKNGSENQHMVVKGLLVIIYLFATQDEHLHKIPRQYWCGNPTHLPNKFPSNLSVNLFLFFCSSFSRTYFRSNPTHLPNKFPDCLSVKNIMFSCFCLTQNFFLRNPTHLPNKFPLILCFRAFVWRKKFSS